MEHQLRESPVLNALPSDILIHIFSFLRAKDIFSIRKTCKALELVTRERVVWLEAVRKMCRESVLYGPSFDIQNINQRELEFLSMGCHRFQRTTRSAFTKARAEPLAIDSIDSSEGHEEAQPSMVITPLLKFTRRDSFFTEGDATALNRLHLVPGGRFIVTLYYRGPLEIWDLAHLSSPQGSPDDAGCRTHQPCLSISDPSMIYFTIHPAPDPNILRIRLRHTTRDSQDGPLFRTEMVDVDLSCNPPVVKRTGKLDVLIPSRDSNLWTSVNGDIYVLVAGTLITAWNCVTNKCAQWVVPVNASQFFVTDKEVIIVSNYYYDTDPLKPGLYIYKLPPLTLDPQSLSAYQELKEKLPDFIVPFPSQVRPYSKCRGSCDWYTGHCELIWFDLIHTQSSLPKPYFTRIQLVSDSDGDYSIDILPQSILSYALDGAFASRQRMYDSDEKTLAWWSTSHRGEVSCHIGDTFPAFGSPVKEDEETVDLVRDDYGILAGEAWTSLCAVSGRLAYASARHPGPGGPHMGMKMEIVVIDFLPAISEQA